MNMERLSCRVYKSESLSCRVYKSEKFVLQRVNKSETVGPARQRNLQNDLTGYINLKILSCRLYVPETFVLQGV